MAKRLENLVALVTGSSKGIGQGIAIRFGKEGAHVVVVYHGDEEGAKHTQEEIKKAGGKAIIVKADVGKVSDCTKCIKAAFDEFGRLDILVNNAGIEKNAKFWDVTEEDYDKVMDTNLKGPFFMAQAFVKARKERDVKQEAGVRIINISSVHEDLAFPGFASYCAAKGGIRMLTRNLSIELAPLGITVNNICPGAIETPINKDMLSDPKKVEPLLAQIPRKRIGTVEDVANVAVFLASKESDYVTGSSYFVDGGLTVHYEEGH